MHVNTTSLTIGFPRESGTERRAILTPALARPRCAPDRAQVQQQFFRELAAAELWLSGESIPHALVGSLACWAHAGQAVAPVFGRPEAFSAVQRYPDIDVLVPRAALNAVRKYARAARNGPFPVAIDVSGAACFIDLRPDCEQSHLGRKFIQATRRIPGWFAVLGS